MRKLAKTILSVPKLVTAYKVLAGLFVPAFIHAPVTVWNITDTEYTFQKNFHFKVEGFGHGIGAAILNDDGDLVNYYTKQFTSDDSTIALSEFYTSRHGNREIIAILGDLLKAKLLPALAEQL